MLDCDASFVSVPEFASIRRSLPARLMAATALHDGPEEACTRPASAPLHKAERQAAESFTTMCPAFVDHLPVSDLPPIPVPPLADLRAEAARHFAPAPETIDETDDLAQPAPEVDAEARPVTPRRPLRFTAARSAEDAAPVTLPSFNLFDGVFEDTALDGPGVDPRLQRSRARARAHLAAMEAALTPVERNLWHDDPEPEPPAQPVLARAATEDATTAEATPRTDAACLPRRPVRHLTAADIRRTPRPAPQIHDPLRDRLHDLRDILYTPTPEETEAAAAAAAHRREPLPQRALSVLLPMVALLLTALQAARLVLRAMAKTTLPQPSPVAQPMALPTVLMQALQRALPARSFAPRLAAAAAVLVATALPTGLMLPPDLFGLL